MADAPVREPRSSVIIVADVVVGETAHPCRVRNLSTTGACIDDPGGVTAGARVEVRIGVVPALGATIAWVANGRAGLRFDRTIDLAAARQPRERRAIVRDGWMAERPHAHRTRG